MAELLFPADGLWLPLVTPFRDDRLDEASLQRLMRHYGSEPIAGLILAATTGERLSLDEDELERLVSVARAELSALGRDISLFLGISESCTRKALRQLRRAETWPVDGYLMTCPFYLRPSQEGLTEHFTALASATVRPILLYNIPYRTGVNLGNDALLELATLSNVVGLKDCAGDMAQSLDLLRRKPSGFAILTGEDALFHTMLLHGAEGAILASAHLATRTFAQVGELLRNGRESEATTQWNRISDLPKLLFSEPSPAPIKHALWRLGLIDSAEVRLPIRQVSRSLAGAIDNWLRASILTCPEAPILDQGR